jgi:hypothetical protein
MKGAAIDFVTGHASHVYIVNCSRRFGSTRMSTEAGDVEAR